MSTPQLPATFNGFDGGIAAASAANTGPVRAAIARAAEASGVDFSYLLAQAKLESSLNPNARAATSSAAGLYQFTDATWRSVMARHGGELGGGCSAGPATSGASQMTLRYDPDTSARMAAALAVDNRAALTASLGRAPDSAELYLGHFLGAGGATRFLTALAANPAQSAASVLPRAAASNRAIFYDAGGSPRSLGAMMDLLRGRLAAAMESGEGNDALAALNTPGFGSADAPADAAAMPGFDGLDLGAPGGPLAGDFAAARAANAAVAPAATPTAMSDILRDSFALGNDPASTSAPAFVRAAYDRLTGLGL